MRTFEYVYCFACFGCDQVYVSVVSEFGVNCVSPSMFGCVVMGSVVLSICVRGE